MRDQIVESIVQKFDAYRREDGFTRGVHSPAFERLVEFLTNQPSRGVGIIELGRDPENPDSILMRTSRDPGIWQPLADVTYVIHDMLSLAEENDLTPRERAYLLAKLNVPPATDHSGVDEESRPRKTIKAHPEGRSVRLTTSAGSREYYPEEEMENLKDYVRRNGGQLHKYQRGSWVKIV